MKKLILLSALFLYFSPMNAQEVNTDALKKLSQKFNTEFSKNKAQANKTYNLKNYWGKYKNIPVFVENLDQNQILSTDTDYLHNGDLTGAGVTGNGMTIYQWDAGNVLASHQEMTGRVNNPDDENTDIAQHSTAIASIIMAAGVESQYKGLAPDANLTAYSNANNFAEIAEVSAIDTDYIVSNHSYGWVAGWRQGDYGNGNGWYWFGYPDVSTDESLLLGLYSPLDTNFDEIAENAPQHLIIKSAGNHRGYAPENIDSYYALDENDEWLSFTGDIPPANCAYTGYDCLPYGSVAKNILLVGSIEPINGRYSGASSVEVSSFSAFGPTDDGRIKPDVVAQGGLVDTADSNADDAYLNGVSGTSASAPCVTGVAALLQQLYYEKNGSYMNASLLKALLINTTNETGEFEGPDYQYGWGLIDTAQAAQLILSEDAHLAIFKTETLSDGESHQISCVPANWGTIRATLVWIDPAYQNDDFSLNNRTPNLVNDLDLKLIAPDATTTLPWTLDPETPAAAATRGDNILDNVERIDFYDAEETTEYLLQISHKGTLAAEQSYALVVSNAVEQNMGTQDETDSPIYSIYPNPTDDFITLNSDESLEIKIYNYAGQLIKNLSTKPERNQIDISNFKAGNYLFIIRNENRVFAEKIIKR